MELKNNSAITWGRSSSIDDVSVFEFFIALARGRLVISLEGEPMGFRHWRGLQLSWMSGGAPDQPTSPWAVAVIGNFRQDDEVFAARWAAHHHCPEWEEGSDLYAVAFSRLRPSEIYWLLDRLWVWKSPAIRIAGLFWRELVRGGRLSWLRINWFSVGSDRHSYVRGQE